MSSISIQYYSHCTAPIMFTPTLRNLHLCHYFFSATIICTEKNDGPNHPIPPDIVQKFASRWITSEESSNPTKALDGRIYAIMVPPNYPSRNKGLIWFNLRPKA